MIIRTLYTKKDACSKLGITRVTLKSWIQKQLVPIYMLPNRKNAFISGSDINKLIKLMNERQEEIILYRQKKLDKKMKLQNI